MFCTDYCLASYEQSKCAVKAQKVANLTSPVLNPFRSPLRMVYTDNHLPRLSNALLFTVVPFSESLDFEEDTDHFGIYKPLKFDT